MRVSSDFWFGFLVFGNKVGWDGGDVIGGYVVNYFRLSKGFFFVGEIFKIFGLVWVCL